MIRIVNLMIGLPSRWICIEEDELHMNRMPRIWFTFWKKTKM